MSDLGNFLRKCRLDRKLTLRAVEKITDGKVSNAYLSQLENGHIANPSAIMLHRLSAAYAVDYAALMEAAMREPQPPEHCPTCGQVL